MGIRIKFIAKFIVAVAVLAAYASCDFNPCVRGEGAKTECAESMYLYVLNATDNEVQIGDLKLQPSEKKELTSSYYGDVIGL
ncbi:MAG: hypothetical protein IJ269_06870, partial [Bacteroidales bacterium]|nr:hypothetical protein [Bacteroidales bacterium]